MQYAEGELIRRASRTLKWGPKSIVAEQQRFGLVEDDTKHAAGTKAAQPKSGTTQVSQHGCLTEWTAAKLEGWLVEMGMHAVAASSLQIGVDGATAAEMDKSDWKELGATGVSAAMIIGRLKKLT